MKRPGGWRSRLSPRPGPWVPYHTYLAELRRLLPSGWTLDFTVFSSDSSAARADGSLTVAAPDGSTATVLVEVKPRLRARQARELAMEGLSRLRTDQPASGLLVLTRFASPLSRQRLREAGICYLDLTGNAWISLEKPAVYIERQLVAPTQTRVT